MREEVHRWLMQAEEEFDTARISFDAKKWFATAFWAQQASEKALKALYLHKNKLSAGTTHSLTYLGRELKIPKDMGKILRELTKEYYMSRYPDASEDIPYLLYTKEDGKEFLDNCEKILEWVKQQIKK